MSQEPMPLGDLPEYLKSLQEKGDTGGGMLVGMGQITPPPQKKSYWKHAMIATLLLMTVGVGGAITYQVSNNQSPAIVDVGKPKASNPPTITADVNEDEAMIATEEEQPKERKRRRPFLDWLFGN